MAIIYVVTSGEYSDYQIDGVYSEEALANKSIEMGRGSRVEEYELDEWAEILRAGRGNYSIYAHSSNISAGLSFEGPKPLILKFADYMGRQSWFLAGTVEATSEEHARKIVAEKLAQIQVEGGAPGVTIENAMPARTTT